MADDPITTDNVTPLFPPSSGDDLLVGPFAVYKVVIEGRMIPRLTGFPDGDRIALVVDGRFSASFLPADARDAAWLIAQALAVGAGYSYLGAEAMGHPFAPLSSQTKGVEYG